MQNIPIAKGIAKAADFGFAKLPRPLLAACGTKGYAAPEAYDGLFTKKSDVYSFGHVKMRTFLLGKTEVVDTWIEHWVAYRRIEACQGSGV
eukprot:3364685-Amphidinium_carterae.1